MGEDELLQHEHKQAEGYLDTLSKEEVRKSTWEVYKDQVEKAKKEKENHDEVDCKNICLYMSCCGAGCWLVCFFLS